MTLRGALDEAAVFLRNAGIENYRLDAALLLANVLGTDRTELLIGPDTRIKTRDYKRYSELLERRADHECTAYITNSREFRFLEFYVDKNVLVPRPETETLVEAALRRIDKLKETKDDIRVLDMCTGSGAVALSLKHERPFIKMYASDISEAALAVAQRNAEKHKLQNDVRFIQSDIFENITGRFDIIVSNPPYIPHELIKTLQAEVQKEPAIALDGGRDGLEIVRRIVSGAKGYLPHGGHIFIEAAPDQMDSIAALLVPAGFDGIEISRDLSGAGRVIGACINNCL
ncbi:MAG: peptide chain release factor N(5)-glutamine methyltransferase [Spirochaetaceae bacterium]|jgi:release factor glutamine methyltransferase|nr:peptide chain release factor N(5)-glutamine methyltransferase [Spirochaetaceae bacterium]